MGGGVSRFRKRKLSNFLVVGPAKSGKSTMILRMKYGQIGMDAHAPNIVESVWHERHTFTLYDNLGNRFANGPNVALHGVIFVVDAFDQEKLGEAEAELRRVLCDRRLTTANILVLANKQDLPDPMSATEVKEKLSLDSVLEGRNWTILGSSAPTGAGIQEAYEWLAANRTEQKKRRMKAASQK